MNVKVRGLVLATSAAAIVAIAAAALLFPIQPEIGGPVGLLFWTCLTLLGSAMPVQLPKGVMVSVSAAPGMASIVLGGPFAAAIIAAIGTTDSRELARRIPWYGTVFNHSAIVLAIVLAGALYEAGQQLASQVTGPASAALGFGSFVLAGIVLYAINWSLSIVAVSARTGVRMRAVWAQDVGGVAANLLGLVPLAWLMAQIFQLPNGVGWWATPLFVVPLFTTRLAYHRYVETRDLFEQTIGALAKAVDARDKYTRGHSGRVSHIAEHMCRVMRLPEGEIDVIKWAGLLHDVGKIGVRDNVLLKEGPLTREERILMNQHPVIGAEIVQPASQLAKESPLIRAHHEWFNGSGYPDGLEALDIPLGARILGVADSYEAMTSARPYRKVPLTHEQAVAELEKYAGIQFDPEIVPVLTGLDREILDRHPERDDELPTMLGQSDPRDRRPDDADRQPEEEREQEQEREQDEKRQLPAPRAAMVGRLYEDRESTQRRTRPVLADDVS